MTFEKNKYYKLSTIGAEAVLTAEQILKQYPLTRVFLNILGRYFIDQLLFGIFSPNQRIIQQGEKGKDLILICSHTIDVTVDGNMIVQMPAPALIGDKGIVDKNSIRNATITISPGQECLVLRMPMGLFIRGFTKTDIKDTEYNQEKQLYYNLFLEIQERLFKYSDVQKRLWEEISARINSLNNQLIGGIISRGEKKDWKASVLKVGANHIQSAHQTTWPDDTPMTVKSIGEMLKMLLESRFPRSIFKGSDQAYEFKKKSKWKEWLSDLSDAIIKVLPHDQLPISIGEIELFNPRVYQMRMNRLVRSIEKSLIAKKIKKRDQIKYAEVLNMNRFFDKNSGINGFNLELYLTAINTAFELRSPNRVSAQIAQQVAQLGALCENEFNVSVSRMRYFLEKLKKLSGSEEEAANQQPVNKALGQHLKGLEKGFDAFHKRMMGQTSFTHGRIKFSESTHPDIENLISSCSTDHVKAVVNNAYHRVLESLNLTIPGLSKEQNSQIYHLCEINPESLVTPRELAHHRWIPITNQLILKTAVDTFSGIKPGQILGGNSWDDEAEDPDKKSTLIKSWVLTTGKSKKTQKASKGMAFVIPRRHLPWIENSNPDQEELEQNYLPIIQWMTNRFLEQIQTLEGLRKALTERFVKVSEAIVTEKNVHDFENNNKPLTERQHETILEMVIDELGIKLESLPKTTSRQLSQRLYNAILVQTKRDFSNLKIEEQGNKAYTLWRFMQSEIVNRIYLKDAIDKIRKDVPKTSGEVIVAELDEVLATYSIKANHSGIQLSSSTPFIDLKAVVLSSDKLHTPQKLKACLSILEVLELQFKTVIDMIIDYQKRLKKISSIKTEFDVSDIQSKFIKESVNKLQHLLLKRLGKEARKVQPN